MFKQLTAEVPQRCVVACSGGADSLAALIFAHNHGKRDISALHVKHSNNSFAEASESFVKNVCEELEISLEIVDVSRIRGGRNTSLESVWSRARAEAYAAQSAPVLVAHTLNDAVEWWLMRSIRGKQPTLIQPKNGNVFRPFLMWEKSDMKSFLTNRKRVWLEDPTNLDGKSNMRSRIRSKLIPVIEELGDLKPALSNMYRNLKETNERRQEC